jgi:hypothetical protein
LLEFYVIPSSIDTKQGHDTAQLITDTHPHHKYTMDISGIVKMSKIMYRK